MTTPFKLHKSSDCSDRYGCVEHRYEDASRAAEFGLRGTQWGLLSFRYGDRIGMLNFGYEERMGNAEFWIRGKNGNC
jgi:hypothetical protein